MRSPAVALTLVAAVLAIGAARQALGASIDPLLLPVLSGQSTPQVLGLAVGGIASDGAGPSALSVSFRFMGSLDDLRGLGIRVGGALGDVATAEVSVAELRLLASHPSVRSIEAARPLSLKLNTSVPLTGANQVRTQIGDGWSETSYTGRGVLIGIMDTGVDLSHGDFLKPDGTTRALAVWDQSTAVGRPPRGFSYGAECTVDQINARDCPQVDRDSHGTHVAGIAAGDGSATSGDQAAYRYIGMAPEADLLVVKMADLTTTRAIDALSYLKSKTAALGKPIVVNLSFGSTLGPHDGTSDLERAVDAFTGPDDRPGAVAVVAAGNDGQTIAGNPLHAAGCFQTGSSPPPCASGIAALPGAIPAPVSFVVPDATTLVYLDIWYPGNATLGVAVTEPSTCATARASLSGTAVVTASTPCGNIVITAGDTNDANGDRRSFVVLTSGSELTTGIWSLSITGDTLPATGATRFDIWSDAQPSGNAPAFNTLGSAQTTIITPASAAEAIATVPYVSKITWISLLANCCQLPAERGTLNNVAPYASQGPLRPCTTCGTLPQKPDLAAPGLMITSSFSSRVPDDPLLDAQIDPDRLHYALEGSSMAAPHVTGAAALLLQVNPTLTARQVKTYLLDNVSAPQVPLPHPVEKWGQGRLNVQAAIAAMKAAGDDPPPAAPAGLRVTSVHSQRVALAWDAAPDLDLRSYQVLRRAEADLVAVLVRELSPTQTAVEDADPLLTNETAYIYTVQAVDMSGLSSGASAEVRAVPTAGEGSTGLCFIATAAYGSAWHPHVTSLRTFRDRHLRPHSVGRAAIATYEAISPPVARLIAPHPALRAVVRAALTPLVLTIEHPRAAAALLGLGFLGAFGLALRRRSA
jgi:subtilisin family serine protease